MSRPNLSSVAVVVAFGISALTSTAAPAQQDSVFAGDTGGTAHVVNGVTTGFYPAVGALLLGDAENGRTWCSGTLIGCRTFLTAAHCVCPTNGATCTNYERPNPTTYSVFFQQAGFVGVEAIVVHPAYQFPHADLAIVTLAQPVTTVRPLPINTEGSPAPEAAATIVGFGNSGGGNADYGIKRSGRVVVADGMVGQGDGLLGWHFRGPMGDPGSNANTCGGDSGGPLLLESIDGWMLAGTTTGGQNGSCLTDDVSIDTDVFMYHDWIREVGGGDVANAPCVDAIPIDETEIQRFSADGVLDEGRPTAVHAIDVAAGVTQLLITMNGVDDGRSHFDLDVRGPDSLASRCTPSGSSQFAVCELTTPAAGPWEIRVNRVTGNGPYQLNAVAVGSDCSRAEHEGQACNDGDPCTRGDVCQSGACHAGSNVDDDPVCVPRTCSPTPLPECQGSAALHRPLLAWPGRAAGQPAFTWRWRQSTLLVQPDYGDPTAGTEYAFCVYGDDEDTTPLLLQAALRSGDGWYRYQRGFSYRGEEARGAGISHARLRTDTRSRTTILVKGRGINPVARVSRRNHNRRVRAQLQGDSGCWETSQMLSQRAGTK